LEDIEWHKRGDSTLEANKLLTMLISLQMFWYEDSL